MRAVLINSICLIFTCPAVGAASGGEKPPGELVFLALRPRARERPAPASAYHAEVLMNVATALAAELADEELPEDLVTQIATQVGELIATAWTPRLPPADREIPGGLRRLMNLCSRGSAAGRRPAEEGLRRVIEVVAEHARRRPTGPSLDPNATALAWLARIDHPIAVAALFSVGREGPDAEVRREAARRLGELAVRKSPAAFTEACARILLE